MIALADNPLMKRDALEVFGTSVCKVLTGDEESTCVNGECFEPSWSMWVIPTEAAGGKLCDEFALAELERDYNTHVQAHVFPLVPAAGLNQECLDFMARFQAEASRFFMLPSVSGCSASELLKLRSVPDKRVGTALRGVLNMYGLVSIGQPLESDLDVSFLKQLDGAIASFPLSVRTNWAMIGGGAPVLLAQHLRPVVVAPPPRADDWLEILAQNPVGMSFGDLMDLILSIHSHAGVEFPSPAAPRGYIPRFGYFLWNLLGKTRYELRVEQFLGEHSQKQDDVKERVEHAIYTALKLIDELRSVTDRARNENFAIEQKQKSKGVTQAEANKYKSNAAAVATYEKWLIEEYPVVLIYFIHLRSNGIADLSPATKTKWGL